MPVITFIQYDGTEQQVDAEIGASIMQTAIPCRQCLLSMSRKRSCLACALIKKTVRDWRAKYR